MYFCEDDNLTADVRGGNVEHVTFSSGGGWFVRYKNGNVRLSMTGTFPKVFHEVTAQHQLMTTKGSSAYALQASQVSNIFFGTDDAIIIQCNFPSTPSWTHNPRIIAQGLPDDIQETLLDMHTKGWALSRNTCLSPHDKNHYYIEWTCRYGKEIRSMYSLPAHWSIPPLFVRQISEGEIPISVPNEPPKEVFPKPLT